MSFPTQAEWETVWLDDRMLPALNPVQYQNLATFQQKVTIGDYTKDSDERLSSRVYSDFTGGGQLYFEDTGADVQRSWIGTLEERYPGQITLGREIVAVTGPNTNQAFPLGDLGGYFFAAWGTDIRRWTAAGGMGGTTVGTLASPPVGKAIEFDNLLWIPLGSAGYATFDGTTVTAGAAGITPIAFEEHDQKVFALEHDGYVSYWDGTTWTSPATLRLRSSRPRSMVEYRNQNGEPTLYVGTDRDLYAVDLAVPKLYRTELRFPPHPDRGRGLTTSQNDLYLSIGPGAFRYNNGTISAVGLDRDHGLPSRLRGRIWDFEPEFNGVYALVRSTEQVTSVSPVYVTDETSVYDDPLYYSPSNAISSLHVFSFFGWHLLWEAPVATTATAWSRVSSADGEYRLWWGDGSTLYSRTLPIDFHNPETGLEAGIDRFQTTGYLETARFNGGMEGYTKAASHVILRLSKCPTGTTVRILYRIDGLGAWTELGSTTAAGRTALPFGVDGMGVAFQDIQFRIEMTTTNALQTPVLGAMILKYTKEPEPGGAWTFTVPLRFQEWNGRSPEEIAADLDDLLAPAGSRPSPFLWFTHRDLRKRVRVSYVTGADATGAETPVARQVSVVEIPDGTEG